MPVAVDTAGKLGFFPSLHDSAYYTYKKYSIVSAAKYAATTSYKTIILQAISLGKMFSGDVSVREISGPIGMASMFSKTWDWQSFWSFCAMISIVLAFMNLLPIPVLDGGHIVILLIEGIIGRPLSVKTMNVIQTIGMIIVLVLMVFAFGNDILKKFGL